MYKIVPKFILKEIINLHKYYQSIKNLSTYLEYSVTLYCFIYKLSTQIRIFTFNFIKLYKLSLKIYYRNKSTRAIYIHVDRGFLTFGLKKQ